MECQEHQTMNMDSCEKKTSNFGSKFKLACFLLDILFHISYNSWYYCYCNFSDKCLMCRIPNIFDEIEKNIYDDVLGYNFLEKYHCTHYFCKFSSKKKTVFVAFCTKNVKIRAETREMELPGASQH